MVQPLEESQSGAVPFPEKRRDKCVRIQSLDFIRFITRHFDINWRSMFVFLHIGMRIMEFLLLICRKPRQELMMAQIERLSQEGVIYSANGKKQA
jgi:hypothetical protein